MRKSCVSGSRPVNEPTSARGVSRRAPAGPTPTTPKPDFSEAGARPECVRNAPAGLFHRAMERAAVSSEQETAAGQCAVRLDQLRHASSHESPLSGKLSNDGFAPRKSVLDHDTRAEREHVGRDRIRDPGHPKMPFQAE